MKSTLLCTTALAMTGIAGAANAAEVSAGAVNMGFSGFYTTGLAYASVDTGANIEALYPGGTDYDGVDIYTNAEIHFKPSITLDNGIKIGIDVELEADSIARKEFDRIDEAYMSISGDFGQVLIGSENSVGYKMAVAAPDVSHIYAQSSTLTAYVPYAGRIIAPNGRTQATFTASATVTPSGSITNTVTNINTSAASSSVEVGDDLFRGTLGATYIENNRNNDAMRLSYFSPHFGGLQLGISYARDSDEGNGPVDNNTTITDIVDIAAKYSGSFSGVDFDGSARYGIASAPGGADDPEVWGGGLSLGFSGFSFGGSYAEQEGTSKRDGSAYDVGIGYANGPMSYSLTYFKGKNIDNQHVNDDGEGILNGAWAYEELETIMLAAKYKVNSNFSVGAFIADTQFEEDFADDGVADGGDNVGGTVLGVTASFSF
jgi:outer membrane protein OmpU